MPRTKNGRRIALLSGVVVVAVLAVSVWVNRQEVRAWYLFWREFESLGKNAQGYLEYKHLQTGIVFVALPGGTFTMGSPKEEEGRTGLERQLEVALGPFLIAKYEVTNREWNRVMENNPSFPKGDALPVEGFSWEQYQKFSTKTGLCLPNSVQWEYACRAGTSGPFSGSGKLDDMGWYKDNSNHRLRPVGRKQPNDFGLHDMHGNVYEWCQHVEEPESYSKHQSSDYLEVRGGSIVSDHLSCRSAFYFVSPSGSPVFSAGLRPAWSWP